MLYLIKANEVEIQTQETQIWILLTDNKLLDLGCLNVVALDCTNYQEEEKVFKDVGTNVTLPCLRKGTTEDKEASVYWVRNGPVNSGEDVLEDGSLFMANVDIHRTGCYACIREEDDQLIVNHFLVVKGNET